MNTENILRLADEIEQRGLNNLGFNMKHFYSAGDSECGTTACIAGWAVLLEGRTHPMNLSTFGCINTAARWLGLDPELAKNLFCPGYTRDEDHCGWNATPKQAAQVLRHLAETGEVNWCIISS